MQIKLLDTMLLVAVVIGCVLTYRADKDRQRLLVERNRLEKKAGSLRIEDPSKVHVLALETGEPMHFAWRIYIPAGHTLHCQCISFGGHGKFFGQPTEREREVIARVRLWEGNDGILSLHCSSRSRGGIFLRIGTQPLADLLRDRWDEAQVEQAGSNEVMVVDPDEVATLLQATLSEDLKREAKQKLDKNLAETLQSSFLKFRIGTEKAFRKADADPRASGQSLSIQDNTRNEPSNDSKK